MDSLPLHNAFNKKTSNNKFMCFHQKYRMFGLLAGITVLSLLITGFCWFFEPTISRDGIFYLELVQIWHDQGNFQGILKEWPRFWLPPFPLYLMKLLTDCGLSAETAGVGLNIAMGCCLPVIVYGIAMEITRERKIALCSALLMLLNPSMIELAIEVQRDVIYLFFCGLLIYFLACGIRRQKWFYWGLAGVFFACSFLTRYETLEFVPLIAFYFLFLLIAKYMSWKKLLINASVFLASMAAVFFLLIHTMGVQEHLFGSYQKYYLQKWRLFERVCLGREAKK